MANTSVLCSENQAMGHRCDCVQARCSPHIKHPLSECVDIDASSKHHLTFECIDSNANKGYRFEYRDNPSESTTEVKSNRQHQLSTSMSYENNGNGAQQNNQSKKGDDQQEATSLLDQKCSTNPSKHTYADGIKDCFTKQEEEVIMPLIKIEYAEEPTQRRIKRDNIVDHLDEDKYRNEDCCTPLNARAYEKGSNDVIDEEGIGNTKYDDVSPDHERLHPHYNRGMKDKPQRKMSVDFGRISDKVRKQSAITVKSFVRRSSMSSSETKKERRLARISLCIVWLFIFCHVWKLIPTAFETFFTEDTGVGMDIQWPPWLNTIKEISHTLITINSALNFLIYIVL